MDEKLLDKLVLESTGIYQICNIPENVPLNLVFSMFIIFWESKRFASNANLFEININNLPIEGPPEFQAWFKTIINKFKIINFSSQNYSSESWYNKIQYIFSIPNWDPYYLVFF